MPVTIIHRYRGIGSPFVGQLDRRKECSAHFSFRKERVRLIGEGFAVGAIGLGRTARKSRRSSLHEQQRGGCDRSQGANRGLHSARSVFVEKASSSEETSATLWRELVGGINSRPGPCWDIRPSRI